VPFGFDRWNFLKYFSYGSGLQTMWWSNFLHCEKVSEKQLKGGKTYLGSQSQEFLSKIGWIHCFGPEVKPKHGGRSD
jgi:hypothetical protein